MVLDFDLHRTESIEDVIALSTDDLPAIQALYADGNARGEYPEFFVPSMLDDGVYYGAFENTNLVAVAGTHVVAPGVRVAGLGNIYTRHDRRGHGHSTRVTGAVINKLRSMGITTIVLNVRSSNDAAIRVYEGLGFARYCNYYEAIVSRIG